LRVGVGGARELAYEAVGVEVVDVGWGLEVRWFVVFLCWAGHVQDTIERFGFPGFWWVGRCVQRRCVIYRALLRGCRGLLGRYMGVMLVFFFFDVLGWVVGKLRWCRVTFRDLIA
jgi:hypothetical protein